MTKAIRPIRIEGNLAYVTLTRGYETVIDASDVPLVNKNNWCVFINHSNGKRYAKFTRATRDGKFTSVLMHRVFAGVPNKQVDHKDGDGLNNRRGNLRTATTSQNQQNQRLSKANTSGFKGVTPHKETGTWRARVRLNGRQISLGLFPSPELASAAYEAETAKLFGDFARLS